MDTILRVENISKTFTTQKALTDVSLEIPRGSVYGLLGPNGAGKSTLIRIINRITVPDCGHVYLNGHEITDADVRKIGYLPEERGLYKKMKVGEQAIFFARLKGMTRNDANIKLKYWFDKFGIGSWWNRKVEDLSKGMAQKIQFIVTIAHEPELLIFDEPFSGFDPINANLLKEEILSLRDKGATVIFSTHNMASVEEICDDITLINKSRNILSGSVSEIRHSHGGDIFDIEFNGNEMELSESIKDLCTLLPVDHQVAHHYSTLRVHAPENLREIINICNQKVELRSFKEIIPSMNDIFINAVEGKL